MCPFLLCDKALGSALTVFAVRVVQSCASSICHFPTAPEPDEMILHNPIGSWLNHQHIPSLWREPASAGGESAKGETSLHRAPSLMMLGGLLLINSHCELIPGMSCQAMETWCYLCWFSSFRTDAAVPLAMCGPSGLC